MSTHAGKRSRHKRSRFKNDGKEHEIVVRNGQSNISVKNDLGQEIQTVRSYRGGPVSYLTDDQRKTFLGVIEAGGNYATALKVIGASFTALKNTLQADKEFAELYKINCQARPGYCEMEVYGAARDGNLNACLNYINIDRNRKSDKQLIKAEKREISRREEELRRQAGLDQFTDKKADTSALSDGEWKSFLYLHEIMTSKRHMADDQKLRYFELLQKMFSKQG